MGAVRHLGRYRRRHPLAHDQHQQGPRVARNDHAASLRHDRISGPVQVSRSPVTSTSAVRSGASRGGAPSRGGRTGSVRSGTERQTGGGVSALYDAERRCQAEETRRKRRARAEAKEHSRFFNRPSADADFVHWSKTAYWTIDEGVALLLGKAPETVYWESVRDYAEVSPFVRQYAQIRDLAMRARESGQLALGTEPRAFLEWAKRTGIEYPSELEEQVMSTTRARRTEAVTDPSQAPP